MKFNCTFHRETEHYVMRFTDLFNLYKLKNILLIIDSIIFQLYLIITVLYCSDGSVSVTSCQLPLNPVNPFNPYYVSCLSLFTDLNFLHYLI